MKKALDVGHESKLLLLISAIATCILIALYAGFAAHTTLIYTHFFYIPILLAGIWYQRKAIYVAIVLCTVHILVTYTDPAIGLTANEFARAAILLIVAYAVGYVSEREAEKGRELQASEKGHQTILDSVPVGIFHIDSNSIFVHVNEALAKRYGLKPEDFKGKSTRVLFPEKAEEYIKSDREALGSGEPQIGVVKKLTTPEGVRWVRLDKVPIKDADGNVTGIIGFELDVTERKRMEEELQRSEARYRTIFEATKSPTAIVNEDTTLDLVNEEFAKLAGYAKEELGGKKSWTEFVVKEDLELMKKYHHARRADPGGAPRSYEFRFLDRYGNVRNIYLTIAMIPGTKRSVASFMDITEERRYQEALKESEEKYRAFFETSRDCVFFTAKDGSLIDVNDAGMELFGYENRDEMLKVNVTDTYANPEERKGHIQLIAQQGFAKDFPVNLRRKDGSIINTLISSVVRKDATVNVIGFQGTIRDITQRKQAEEALRQSRMLYHDLVENSPEIIYQADNEGNLTFLNKGGLEAFEVPEDEIVGAPWAPNVHPDDLPAAFEAYKKMLETGEPLTNFECRFVAKRGKGRVFPAIQNITILKDDAGKIIGTQGIARDITEYKKMMRDLDATKATSESIIESANALIMAGNAKGELTIFNKAYEELTGYKKEEVLGKPFTLLMPEEEYEKRIAVFKGAFEGKHVKDHEITILTKDGERKITSFNSAMISDGEGNPVVIGIGYDITARKQAEEELRESEEKFRTFMETASDLMSISDKGGKCTYVNTAMARTLGYSEEELIGMHITQILTKEAVEKDFKPNWEKFITSGEISLETSFATKAGGRIYGELKAVAIYDSDGKLAGSRAVIHDITERKQADKMQLKLITELGLANKELENFAYVVSHDLKAPLRGISSLAEWLSTDYADKLDEAGKEQLSLLKGRAKRMHKLIDGILQYSRVGRKEEEKEKVDLNTLVPEVIDMITPLVKDIDITVANELPVIVCSRTRMVQVFQNLLTNAVKYIMDKPVGKVTIGCTEGEDGYWKFSVADNGPGIDEKHYERIFQIFQTLQSRDEVESTGVGLTIVKKIVEMNGGKIWIESKVGEGSTFFFTLPKTTEEV